MSQRIRGQEATIRLTLDGQLLSGSMFKTKDFSVTPRQDIMETDYVGETETDLDFQHHGFDLSWSVDLQDSVTIDLLSRIINAELSHQRHPVIVATVTYTFRDGPQQGKIVAQSYHTNFILKQGEEGAGSRKDYVAVKYEAKCKRRSVIQ